MLAAFNHLSLGYNIVMRLGGISRLVAAATFCLTLLWPLQALAIQQNATLDLTTSPISIGLDGQPGKTITTDLKVKNNGVLPEHLKLVLMKFTSGSQEGDPAPAPRAAGDDYFDWVSFSQDTLDIASNEWKTVTMTIKLPNSAAGGYYYMVTYTRTEANGTEGIGGIGAASTLVLVDAHGSSVKRKLEPIQFTTDHTVYEFLPTNFTAVLRNQGGVHLAPIGNIFIKQAGHQVAMLDVNEERGYILPNSERRFTATWDDGMPMFADKTKDGKVVEDKHNQPVRELHWDLSKLGKIRFGHYTAKLVMAYNDGKRDIPVEGTVSFWVIPWRLLGGLLLVLFVLGYGLLGMLRNSWRRFRRRR